LEIAVAHEWRQGGAEELLPVACPKLLLPKVDPAAGDFPDLLTDLVPPAMSPACCCRPRLRHAAAL
jgi:hypothetical protein